MADIQTLLDQALAPAPVNTPNATLALTADTKKADLAAATAQRKAVLGGGQEPNYYEAATGRGNSMGAATMGEMEADLRNMTPASLYLKYGMGAQDLIAGMAEAQKNVALDNSTVRDGPEQLGDTVTTVASGFGNSLAGIAALGVGLVNDDAGAAMSRGIDTANRWIQEGQSDALNSRRTASQQRQALLMRDNTAEYEADLASGTRPLVADLKRWGKDVVDSADNILEDGMLVGDMTAQGVGSMAGAGVITKGLKKIGEKVVGTIGSPAAISLAANMDRATGTMSAARIAEAATKVGSKAAWPAAVAAMESGGTYQQTMSEVLNTPFEVLEQNSLPYRELKSSLVASGMSDGEASEEARLQVASDAAERAAAIQAPIAAGASLISRLGEGNPLHVPSARTALLNTLVKEPLEEGIQSTSSQVASNIGVRDFADSRRAASEGVGEQTAQGAIAGMTSAGAVQGPGLAADVAIKGGKIAYQGSRAVINKAVEAGKPVFNAIVERGDRLLRKAEQASPVGDAAMAAAATQVVGTAPQMGPEMEAAVQAADATPEQKAEGSQYVASLVQAMQFDSNSEEMQQLPENMREAIGGATNRIDAVLGVARALSREQDETAQMHLGGLLSYLMEPLKDLKETDPEILSKIPEDSPARQEMIRYEKLIQNIDNNSAVLRGIRAFQAVAEAQMKAAAPDMTAEQLATPEGQQAVRNAVAVAELAPESMNPAVAEGILKHANEGTLVLSPSQRAVLQPAMNLIRAAQEHDKAVAASGLQQAKDVVSSQIVSGNDPLRAHAKSARQHTKDIVQAYRSGNLEVAAARLQDFGLFVQHMKNKVEALNKHIAGGNPNAPGVPYMALMPHSREWTSSENNPKALHKALFVNSKSPKSVDQAKSIALEQNTLATVFNGLVEAFPELGVEAIQPLELSAITAPAATAAPATQPQAETKPAPAPVQEAKPVEAPKPVESKAAEKIVTEAAKPAPVEAKVETKPEPAVEAAPQTQVEETPAPAPVAEKPKKGMDLVYPNLISVVPNFFKKVFKLPEGEQAPTRIIGAEDSVSLVQDALSSSSRMTAAMGRSPKGKLTPEIAERYQTLLANDPKAAALWAKADKGDITLKEALRIQNVGGVMAAMESRLQDFLGETFSKKSGQTIGEALLAGEPVNRFARGKALNIVDQVDGKFVYNQELLQGAALAAIQWLLTSSNYETILDTDDVSAMTGIAADEVSDEIENKLNMGMSEEQAKRPLAAKIQKYWGVTAPRTADLAYSEGIPEAVAAEALRALIDLGMLRKVEVQIGKQDGAEKPKTINVYTTLNEKNERLFGREDAINEYNTAIDEMVLVQPDEVTFIDGDMPPVADRQMNNPEVQNTPEQREALSNEQKTPFFVNLPMINLYNSLGRAGVMELFGGGETEGRTLNKQHAASLEGKNRTVLGAFDHMYTLIEQMQNRGEMSGKQLADVAIRFGYNISRVGRMQMLGKHNPQASKLMREALLPTWSTLDLSSENSPHFQAFALAFGQALDIKVHKQTPEATLTEVMAKLSGPLAPAVEMINDWMGETDVMANPNYELGGTLDHVALRDVFSTAGVAMTPFALHALTEYVRYTRADSKTDFKTALYLEADGVTNGPINAMVLMTIGKFAPEWVKNVQKGGLSFGNKRAMHALDSVDLYQSSTENTAAHLSNLVTRIGKQKNRKYVMANVNSLFTLMSTTLKDVSFDPNKSFDEGALQLKRGIAKNPLTITIYGSSANGIAGKLTSMVADSIYAMLSGAADAMANDKSLSLADALFPNDADAKGKATEFFAAINKLTDSNVYLNKETGQYNVTAAKEGESRNFDPVEFKFNSEEIRSIRKNMLEIFVNPMRSGINDTVGPALVKATTELRKATQVQSIVLENLFYTEINKALAEKRANDKNYRPGDFLSRKDLSDIVKKLAAVSPMVTPAGQAFLVTKSKELSSDSYQYGRAFNDDFRTAAFVYSPANAGVAGIPFMTIGMGDGMMMQNLALDTSVQGTLKIFDGMNMPLDKIGEQSEKANKAVYDSWKGNPLRAVKDSYSKFLAAGTEQVRAALIQEEEAARSKKLDKQGNETEEQVGAPAMPMHAALTYALGLRDELVEDNSIFGSADVDTLMAAIKELDGTLSWSADSVDARHTAMQSMAMSVDQMAAAASPFSNSNVKLDANPTDEQIAAALNERYSELMQSKKVAPAPTVQPTPAKVADTVLTTAGVEDKSGARVLSHSALKKLSKSLKLNADQKVIYDQIMRSLGTKEYKIVSGTSDQIQKYQRDRGLTSYSAAENVNGFVSTGDRTIYLINPSNETLVHEMVHAASFETVLAYYQGKVSGDLALDIAGAVARMEVLMQEFLNKPVNKTLPLSVKSAIDDARAAIQTNLDSLELDPAVAKARALNEFMAWGLTNEHLTEGMKNTSVPKIVEMAKEVIKMIKQLIWGKKLAPKVGTDFLSNLQFNASVIIRSQPSLSLLVQNANLEHANRGADVRLTRVRDAFNKKVVDMMNARDWTGQVGLDVTAASRAQALGRDMAIDVSSVFDIGMEQTHTFQMIVAALATEAEIDTNALARAQELYTHVVKNLTVEAFVDPAAVDQEAERYYAQQKYNVIVGKMLRRTDGHNRTTLLPAFLALATVSDEFRSVLAQIAMPKSEANTDGTLDALLENVGTKAMDSLSSRLSGEGDVSNIRDAIDGLNNRIHEIAVDEQTLLTQVSDSVSGVADSLNDWMVGGMESLSEKGMQLGAKMSAQNSKAAKAAGNFLRLASSLATEKNGALVSQEVMSSANKLNLWKPAHDLIKDLVGRTESNADVYDMIKRVRATVQQLRQNFREEVPRVIASKFSRQMKDAEWNTMFRSLAKTDLAALLDTMPVEDALKLFQDQNEIDNQINDLEGLLKQSYGMYWNTVQRKSKQLAAHMNTGTVGSNLLRNAQAVANLLGESRGRNWKVPTKDMITQIDRLVSLYAIDTLAKADRESMLSLVQNEAEGMAFALNYLSGQRKTEQRKALSPKTQYNYYKGHIHSNQQTGVSLMVADDSETGDLRLLGYTRLGDYNGSNLDLKRGSKSYFFAPLSGRTAFSQGIMQNVKHTASGVDSATSMSTGLTAGRIYEPVRVKALAARMYLEQGNTENLMPVFNDRGVIVAFERAVDSKMLTKLNGSQNLPQMLGVWRGRQIEERLADTLNQELVNNLHDMYTRDMAESKTKQEEYVNLFSSKLDNVQIDAVDLFSDQTKEYIREKFGEQFWVRKDMLEDVTGYRNASVGDFWTGTSRMPKGANETMKKFFVGLMGVDAYKNMIKVEQTVQNFMSMVRTSVVVRSMIVPAFNAMSNAYQLISRGVPLGSIVRGVGTKVSEIDAYAKSRLRQIELEAELRAVGDDVIMERKLRTEIKSITDSHKRMSIWPLIEAGEFSTIADVGMTAEDLELTSGNIQGYIEKQISKLPDGLKTAARYGLITRDTALFQGLQKAVQYGDFVAKSILFDDLVKRKKLTKEQALARITEEFVNYDRLPGRFRGYLENMGLLWFYSYKIRISKIAMSTLRNNPVHALMAAALPAPSGVGLPVGDNMFTKAVEGNLGYSVGPGMAFRGLELNPWYNLVN